MAKPKQAVLVEVVSNQIAPINIWIDNPKDRISNVLSIEGVRHASVYSTGPIYIMVDPRYDTQEVADEIRDLLTAEVPAVFKD